MSADASAGASARSGVAPAARRTTISDVARQAGVSIGAVSYALNGKPGVSDATRARVLQVAEEMGWKPNSAARTLAGQSTAAVGLVVPRSAGVLISEHFYMSFIAGLVDELRVTGRDLTLQVAPDTSTEQQIYRTWAAQRRVDGVVVMDIGDGDPRPALLHELALPAVLVGGGAPSGQQRVVATDDAAAAAAVFDHLVSQGHRHIARVAGPAQLVHTRLRDDAFSSLAAVHGVSTVVRHTDYTEAQARAVTDELLAGSPAPTAVVYYNEVMALAGLAHLQRGGVDVPRQVAVVGWDGSTLSRLSQPQLSTVTYDVEAYARLAVRALFQPVGALDAREVGVLVPQLASSESSRSTVC